MGRGGPGAFSSFAVPVALAAGALSLFAPAAPAAAGHGFWDRVVDPDRELVDELCDRAQAELEDRGLVGARREGALAAEQLLGRALAKQPRHFRASALLGEALSLQGRREEAIAQLGRACGIADTAERESWCFLRLGIERSKAGRYAEALADYDRHLRIGDGEPAAHANSAELLMALGRLPEAEERYRRAIDLAEEAAPSRERDTGLALAHYGLAVALDRDDQAQASREALGRALQLDPRLDLLFSARAQSHEGSQGIFFVPPGDVHYYRGLALEQAGRPREALDAFRKFLSEQPQGRWFRRAETHAATLAAALGAAAPPPKVRARVVAAATLHAEGSIPAPRVDAAWRGAARAVEPCFAAVPAPRGETVRLSIDLLIAATGEVEEVTPTAPPGWGDVVACLGTGIKRALHFPKSSRARRTSARLELVLAIRP